MNRQLILPDQFYPLNIEGTDRQYLINAKFDRIDRFPLLGHHILKVYDDEQGLVLMHIDHPTAQAIVSHTRLPMVDREYIYQSEYNGYLEAMDKRIETWL